MRMFFVPIDMDHYTEPFIINMMWIHSFSALKYPH